MISRIKTFAKFIDQPIMISKFNKGMPKVLIGAGSMFWGIDAVDTYQKSKNKQRAKTEILKRGIVITGAISSALAAPKIASKITKRPLLESVEKIRTKNSSIIDAFLNSNTCEKNITSIIKKAKNEPISYKNLKLLMENSKQSKPLKEFLEKLIPAPENITSKDIFSEIGYLSTYGAIPVLGGLTGGIAADIVTKDNFKKNIPDKINEGIYQYLANIFLCNVGAGAALFGLEKLGVHSKLARAVGMTTGIILTGVVGGSVIANKIANKFVSPILKNNKPTHRTPEAIDIGLHADDIATVSLLSGLKWIEPALPLLYTVSGYRAGLGYRN